MSISVSLLFIFLVFDVLLLDYNKIHKKQKFSAFDLWTVGVQRCGRFHM